MVYIPRLTTRISYAVEQVFAHWGGHTPVITEDRQVYLSATEALKCHYSQESLPGLSLYRSGFLDETGIDQSFKPANAIIDGCFCLFPDQENRQFDLLAMVFWCITRYEEYQPFEPDKHGRYPAASSQLCHWGVLETPICDVVVNQLFGQLGLPIKTSFSITPTIDVDIAYAYAGRGLLRSFGALLKNPGSLAPRLHAISNPGEDPNQSFGYIKDRLSPIPSARVFWHCGMQHNSRDKQVRLAFKPFQQCIRDVGETVPCGLHPSAVAFGDNFAFKQEKNWLETQLGKPVADARMHYILLSFPNTYRQQLQAGVAHDYSMGFPDAIGFRAGTARPFLWYDLAAEQARNLMLHPFCIMEATCKHYLALTPEQAIHKGAQLKNTISKAGGDFCFIFHNESLGTQPSWQGWKTVFEAWLA